MARKKKVEMEKCSTLGCSMFCKKGDRVCNYCIIKSYKLSPAVPAGDHPLDESSYTEDQICDAIRQAEYRGMADLARRF